MKIFYLSRIIAFAAVLFSVGAIPASADQIINDNLTVTGSIFPDGGILSTSGAGMSARNINVGDTAAQLAADGNDSTPVATEVYIGEMRAGATVIANGACVMNGSVASGNFKVGVADVAGNVLATSASTAMAGTDAYQCAAFTVTPITLQGPATYYLLYILDNATARYNTFAVGKFGASKQTGQVYATGFTTITPPTTFTTALAPIGGLN